MRSWYPVTDNEMYVVLGLSMLTGIIKKPTMRLNFFLNEGFCKHQISVMLLPERDLNFSADFYISVTMTVNQSTQALLNYSRFSPFCLT
jgi:hypothetical protein